MVEKTTHRQKEASDTLIRFLLILILSSSVFDACLHASLQKNHTLPHLWYLIPAPHSKRVSQSSQVTDFHLLWQRLSVDCFFSVCLDIWSANWTGPVPLNCSGDKRNCGCATNTTGVSISPLERRLCSFSTASYHLWHGWHDQSSSLGKYPYWSSITLAATYVYVSEPPSFFML
jgi:hypothetical protein